MISSAKIQEIRNFLSEDYSWLNKKTLSANELANKSIKYKELKKKISDYSPIIHGTILSSTDEELYNSFLELQSKVEDYKTQAQNSLDNKLSRMENSSKKDMKNLQDIVCASKNFDDYESFYRAKKIHDEEAKLRDKAIDNIETEYIDLRKKFIDNKWKTKNISQLEKMLNESDLLVEKGRYLNDTEIVYHGSELSNQIVGVVNNLKTIKRRQIKTRIGVGIGLALTTFSIIQHYTPVEPVQNATKNAYEWVKEKIEEIK